MCRGVHLIVCVYVCYLRVDGAKSLICASALLMASGVVCQGLGWQVMMFSIELAQKIACPLHSGGPNGVFAPNGEPG